MRGKAVVFYGYGWWREKGGLVPSYNLVYNVDRQNMQLERVDKNWKK